MRSEFVLAAVLVGGLTMIFWYIIAYSFYDVQVDVQHPFATDGCTLFFDGYWGRCCTEHDKAYWIGGTREMRRDADIVFRECMYDVTGKKIFAHAAYGAVRISGVSYIKTPWRWGYGWTFGRGYR